MKFENGCLQVLIQPSPQIQNFANHLQFVIFIMQWLDYEVSCRRWTLTWYDISDLPTNLDKSAGVVVSKFSYLFYRLLKQTIFLCRRSLNLGQFVGVVASKLTSLLNLHACFTTKIYFLSVQNLHKHIARNIAYILQQAYYLVNYLVN